MLRLIARAAPLTVTLLLWTGCARGPREVAYQPPLEMDDLIAGLPTPDNTFTLLSDAQTTGRFSCSLAIARLAPRDDETDSRLAYRATRPNEEAYWTEQMRGVSAIREVFFISPFSTRLKGQQIEGLCDAAVRLEAPLLLVYAANGLGPNSAEVLGVLYETQTRQTLATLHAAARILNEDGEEVSPDGKKGDQRDEDARFQAQRRFEAQALACMRELIELDTPPPSTQPHEWRPLIEHWLIRTRR